MSSSVPDEYPGMAFAGPLPHFEFLVLNELTTRTNRLLPRLISKYAGHLDSQDRNS